MLLRARWDMVLLRRCLLPLMPHWSRERFKAPPMFTERLSYGFCLVQFENKIQEERRRSGESSNTLRAITNFVFNSAKS